MNEQAVVNGNKGVKVLVVEDDVEICMLLEEFLVDQGLEVVCVDDGKAGLRKAEREEFAIILLDVMLPGLSGLDLLDRLRRVSHVPVILLTALGEEDDRIEGLKRGADDYMVKPFSPRELLARMESVLRRAAVTRVLVPDQLKFGQMRVDGQRRMLWIDGQAVDLTDQEFDTLWLLIRNRGRVVGREEMSRVLLGREHRVLDRTIDIRMSRLRQKLGDLADIIRSVRGQGYEFFPPEV